MDRDLKRVIIPIVFVFLFGGFMALLEFSSYVIFFFKLLFPIFGENLIEDYFTSPYFIVGVILAVLSSFGIYLGAKRAKILYFVISLIVLMIDLFSICANIF